MANPSESPHGSRTDSEALQNEHLIEQIAELTPVVINVFDLETERDTYISRDVVTLLGYTRYEMAQMKDPFSTLKDPDDIPRYKNYLARLKKMADGEVIEMEYRIRRRDGEWRWLASRATPFTRNAQGEVHQIVTSTLDVTARRQEEQALRASKERFQRYFELGLIGMAITSPEKGCIEVNDEICKILGYERGELLGMTWAELTHPGDLAADVSNFARVMSGEFDGYTLDKRWIRKDGRVIYSTISVKCMRLENGAVDYFMALLQDITARKQAEEALARSHANLERRVADRTAQLTAINEELRSEIAERKQVQEELLRSEAYLAEAQRISHAGSWAWNVSSGEVFWSVEQFRIFGVDPKSFHPTIGAIQLFIHPEDWALTQHTINTALSERHGFEADFRIVRPDESIRHAHSIGHPVVNESGELVEFVGTLVDVTERKQSEAAALQYQQELQALTAKLVEAQETGNRYLALELHDDISQKLAVLGMDVEALAQRASSQELGDGLLKFTAQIGTLEKDIHRISRQLHPVILEDLGLAVALKNECIAFAEQHGIPTDFDPDDIPRDIPYNISLCLYRVAQECLRNIGKHANTTEVRVALIHVRGEIAMEIADTGNGFNVETIKGKGGLGLISIEERVRMVRGRLSIRSQPGKGTLVNVRVPLDRNQS
jgi:PAS domain S-box-containing protein